MSLSHRRTLSSFDAQPSRAFPPPPQIADPDQLRYDRRAIVARQETSQNMPVIIDDFPARPPRPIHTGDQLLLEAAKALGHPQSVVKARREILSVTRDPAGRMIVEDRSGVWVICTPYAPDDAGHVDATFDEIRSGRPRSPGSRIPRYVTSTHVPPPPLDTSPWTVADLDLAADRIPTPPPGGHASNGDPLYTNFVGNDPILARVAWKRIAFLRAESTKTILPSSPQCRAYRKLIIDSAWLAADEAAKL